MKLPGKLIAVGLALATATGAAVTAAPAEARTQVYLGVGVGNPGYYPVGYHEGYRDRYWRGGGGYREGWRGDYGWRGEGWRGDRWRGGYGGWRGYREHCWMERGPWGRPYRVCR